MSTVEATATRSAADSGSGSGGPAVDAHLADQSLLFLAVAGGRVRIPAATSHVTASLDLLDAFGYDLALDRGGDGPRIVAPP